MTTKSPANAAHDAARAEDERRARAELHAYIDSLERQLRTRAEVADHTRATLNEHLANAERRLAEVTRERDQARERLADALRDRDAADAAFAACARAAECVYEDGTLHDVRTTVAQIEQLVACANTRCTCAQLAAEDEADRIAIAEEERDEARQQRDEVTRERDMAQAAERTFALRLRLVHEALGDPECEVVLTSDLVARRLHEAQEQGARWALLSSEMLLADLALVPQQAARICAKARAKGGE